MVAVSDEMESLGFKLKEEAVLIDVSCSKIALQKIDYKI
jgi:hypothetical protein